MERSTAGRAQPRTPVVLAVRRARGVDRDPELGVDALVASALSAAGLGELVTAAQVSRIAADGPRSEGTRPSVALLVGFGAVAFTSPEVVRAVREHLAGAGLDVALIASVPARDRDLGWHPATLAVRRGLAVASIADPFDDLRDSWFPSSALHHERQVSRAWLDADLRVVLAPLATDAAQGMVGVLAALAGVAPRVPGSDPAEAVADLMVHAAPDLAVLDATVVSHGAFGTAVRRELVCATIAAARSAVLVDVAAGDLVGLDPAVSGTIAQCLRSVGLPPSHVVDGSLAVLPRVVAPTLTLVRSLSRSGGVPGLARVLDAARAVDAAGAPDSPPAGREDPVVVGLGEDPDRRDPVLDGLRAVLEPWVRAGSDGPAAAAVVAGAQQLAAATAQAVTAWRTTFAKDSVERVETGLGLNLADFRAADYEAVPDLLAPLVEQASALPDTGDPLKWQHLDGSVLFEVTRTVNADYGDWIRRVDISQSIRLMADYLGGRRVVVARDRSERSVRQAERNLYLPQPNYVAFTGGQVIDVCKLEVMRYHRDSQEIWWQTVRSPNGSADYDDGTVEFADAGPGRTRVRIRGRQQFTLPLFWQVVDLDRFPGLRETLTTDAYRRFFTSTLGNFEACFEGRPFEIGRPAQAGDLATKDLSVMIELARAGATQWLDERRAAVTEANPTDADHTAGGGRASQGWLGMAADLARGWVDAAASGPQGSRPRPAELRTPDLVDDDGFWHFRGEQA